VPAYGTVRATSGFIRLFIRGLAWDTTEAGAPLVDTLKSAARARLAESARGKILVGTGHAGANVEYTLPPIGNLTADDIAAVCSALLDRVDAIKADNAGISDADLVVALLATFPAPPAPRTVRTFRPDFSCGLAR
jgi:hypothetical protein